MLAFCLMSMTFANFGAAISPISSANPAGGGQREGAGDGAHQAHRRTHLCGHGGQQPGGLPPLVPDQKAEKGAVRKDRVFFVHRVLVSWLCACTTAFFRQGPNR